MTYEDEDNLEEIRDRVSSLDDTYQGVELSNAARNMSGEAAIFWAILCVIASPFLLIRYLIKRREKNQIKAASDWADAEVAKMMKREKEERETKNNNRHELSKECAMKIFDEIKKEEYDNEDPFYAPVYESYKDIPTQQLELLISIMNGSRGQAALRGSLRYLLSLPEDRMREELKDVRTQLAANYYETKTGENIGDDPKTMRRIYEQLNDEDEDQGEDK